MLIPRQIQLAKAPPLRCFHLWSNMVPGLALLADREIKIWAQKFLRRLAENHAVKVQAFAIEDDCFHLVLQWTPAEAAQWNDEEARRRWLAVHPPKLAEEDGVPIMATPDPGAIRRKLGSISMFMKHFKQMLTHKINQRFKRKGTIWKGRFHLAPLADASAVAGAMAFVDLRQVVEQNGDRPEAQPFTSIHARVAAYKGKFGLPPYGPLGEPDGDMQPFGPEVAAELRNGLVPPAEARLPVTPVMPPPTEPVPTMPLIMPPTMPGARPGRSAMENEM